MTRQIIVTAQQILKSRAANWDFHLQLRQRARTYPSDVPARVIQACTMYMPEPKITIRGDLDTWSYHWVRVNPIENLQAALRVSGVPLEMLVKWYWSEQLWQECYVDRFNALEYPEPLYYMGWKDERPILLPYSTPAIESGLFAGSRTVREKAGRKRE